MIFTTEKIQKKGGFKHHQEVHFNSGLLFIDEIDSVVIRREKKP